MLYIFEMDNKVYVSSVDPDVSDIDQILSNSFIASINGVKLNEAIVNITRNVLHNGTASVQVV